MSRSKDFDECEVLTKAVSIFWHKGYNGTSMQDLVDGLGISRSSLYDTYGDKHTLFIKALESYQMSASKRMSAIVDQSTSAKEAIKQLLNLITIDLTGDQQHKGCFSINATVEVAPHDKEIKEIIEQNDRNAEDVFYKAVKKGQESGEIPAAKDAKAIARFIFNTIKGMRVTAKSITDKSVFEDIIAVTMSVLD
jgi:TetR/AcrR family transcriptional repressor of nem operon